MRKFLFIAFAIFASCALIPEARAQVQQVTGINGSPIPISCPSGGCPVSGAPTPQPLATMASPAPNGLLAQGLAASGAVAPTICLHGTSNHVAATTAVVLIAAVAGKMTHICEIDATMYQATTAGAYAGLLESGTQTTNPCDTSTVTAKQWLLADGALTGANLGESITIGTGIGDVAPPSATGAQYCIVTTSANLGLYVNVMYEQI